MNEMEMLARLGRELDQEAPPALGRRRQRQRLMEAAGSPRRRAVRIPRWSFPATAGLAAAALAVAVGVATVGTGSGHHGTPPVRLESAAMTLTHAAQVVAARPAIAPKPHQWIYTKTVDYGGDSRRRPDEEWIRFDSRMEAYFAGGKFIVQKKRGDSGIDSMRGAYDVLRSLPTDPHALLDRLSAMSGRFDDLPGNSALDKNQLLFSNMIQLMRNSLIGAPPKIQAALYRALALLPGVRIDRDVVDGIGRHDIGVRQGTGDRRLLLDQKTYQVVGFETVWDGKPTPAEVELAKTKHLDISRPAGTVTYGLVTERLRLVDKPGQR